MNRLETACEWILENLFTVCILALGEVTVGIILGVYATWLTMSLVTLLAAGMVIEFERAEGMEGPGAPSTQALLLSACLIPTVAAWCTAFIHLLVRFLSGEVIVISTKDFIR